MTTRRPAERTTGEQEPGSGPGEPEAQRRLTEELLARLGDRRGGVRETAAEALAVAAEDDDWRPDDLVLCDGIGRVVELLGDRNPGIVRSALSVVTALARVLAAAPGVTVE